MRLSRYTLNHIAGQQVKVPEPAIFGLPEKVLQFGAGALLRGVPDYFIDKANRIKDAENAAASGIAFRIFSSADAS